MGSLYGEIESLTSQMHKEQTLVGEMNRTISELKHDLQNAQGNLTNISSLKSNLESQQQRANETLSLQVIN